METVKLVLVGHVDHGKSTLIGRLLYETKSIPENKYEQIKKVCETQADGFEFGYILDAFEEERNQGVTIDVAQIYFQTKKSNFLIIDAPGHKEFLKNMISGASSADAAIILIDAKEGIREQSKRHAYILSFLGIKNVIIVINKLDLINYSQDVFNKLKNDYTVFLNKLNIKPDTFIPVSAKFGDNITKHSLKLKWYDGMTFIETLEKIKIAQLPVDKGLRFNVQDVYKFDHRRLIAGRIEAGKLHQGEKIIFWPSGKETIVKSIESWPENDTITTSALNGSVAITLQDPLFIERGELISTKENQPIVTNEFQASILWMGRNSLLVDKTYSLRLLSQKVNCTIIKIDKKINSSTLEILDDNNKVNNNEVAEVVIITENPITFDRFRDLQSTGRFVLIDDKIVCGGGIISLGEYPDRKNIFKTEVTSKNITEEIFFITRDMREKRFKHKGAIIWLTGLSGSGKSTIAKKLEKVLFTKGLHTYVLDGDNVRHGLNSDLGFSPDDRAENIRRIGEIAKLFSDAGLIVITAFISPYKSGRDSVREKSQNKNFIEIYLNCPLEICEKRDPKGLYKKVREGKLKEFTGINSPYEIPENADIVLNTSSDSIENCVNIILKYFKKNQIF